MSTSCDKLYEAFSGNAAKTMVFGVLGWRLYPKHSVSSLFTEPGLCMNSQDHEEIFFESDKKCSGLESQTTPLSFNTVVKVLTHTHTHTHTHTNTHFVLLTLHAPEHTHTCSSEVCVVLCVPHSNSRENMTCNKCVESNQWRHLHLLASFLFHCLLHSASSIVLLDKNPTSSQLFTSG